MTQAIIYARFSPRRHAAECQSIETQVDLCERYCRDRGYKFGEHPFATFTDTAISGGSFKRPGLWSAIKALKRGWVLVAYSSSRLARNVLLSELIYEKVNKRGAFVELVDEGGRVKMDPMSVCMRQVRAAFDELDRRMIGKRTSDAARRLQSNNVAVSKIPPYGKREAAAVEVVKGGRKVMQRTWEDDPEEQAAINEIMHMRRAGAGLRQIAAQLKEAGIPPRGKSWSHVTVARILEREGM